MKNFVIHCNEEQLNLIRTALELQMRIRIGQGWAITENLMNISDEHYADYKDAYDDVLNAVIKNMVLNCDGTCKYADRWIDRDMWIATETALKLRDSDVGLSEYGIMKIEEVENAPD